MLVEGFLFTYLLYGIVEYATCGVFTCNSDLKLALWNDMNEAEGNVLEAPIVHVERDRSPERAHGHFETILLFSDEFIKLSQVRPGKNPILEDLKNSIEKVGMLNAIDVAKMDTPLLEEYIEFTNMVWGSDRNIEDVRSLGVDGFYYPLVAGHSRHQAIEELEAEGRIEQRPIQTKVHPVQTIEDILDLQLGENLHSVPSMERRALAAVEHFTFGVMKGKWTDQDDYYAQHPDLQHDKSLLEDGLVISQLPPNLQDYVFKKKVAFATGIEIAKTGRVLRRHIEFKQGAKFGEMDEVTRAKADRLYLQSLNMLASKIANKRLNAPAAKKVLMAERQRLNNEIYGKLIAASDQSGISNPDIPEKEVEVLEFAEDATLFDILVEPEDELDRALRESDKELSKLLSEYANAPSSFALELLELAMPIVPAEKRNEIMADFERSNRIGMHLIGGSVLQASDVSKVQDDTLLA